MLTTSFMSIWLRWIWGCIAAHPYLKKSWVLPPPLRGLKYNWPRNITLFCLSREIAEATQIKLLEGADLHVQPEDTTCTHRQQQQQQQLQEPQDVHQQISEQQNESPSQGVNQFIVNMTGNFTGPIQINTDQGQGTQVFLVASQGKVSYESL